MTFTFTQQIESTQNEIAQLQVKLDVYSKTDDYLTQSEELLHQVTNVGFKEKDLQIVRDSLQDIWLIENNYDTTAEIEWRDAKIVDLQGKIKSLEANLEMVLEQRDRSNEKYNELLRQQIFVLNQREEEFLDELEPPVNHAGEELDSNEVDSYLTTGECVEAATPKEEEEELLHKFLAGNLDWKDYELLGLVNELGLSPVFPQNKDAYLRAIYEELKKRGYQVYDQPPTPEPIDIRVKNFIKSFNDDTTWKDLKGFALNNSKFLQQMTMTRSRKMPRIKEALPKMLADHIQEYGRNDKNWVGKTLWGMAEKVIKERHSDSMAIPLLTVETAYREGGKLDRSSAA